MAKFLFRLVALITTIAVTSPAWAGWDAVAGWLPNSMPQPGAIAVAMIAVAGVLVGLVASRKRRDS